MTASNPTPIGNIRTACFEPKEGQGNASRVNGGSKLNYMFKGNVFFSKRNPNHSNVLFIRFALFRPRFFFIAPFGIFFLRHPTRHSRTETFARSLVTAALVARALVIFSLVLLVTRGVRLVTRDDSQLAFLTITPGKQACLARTHAA